MVKGSANVDESLISGESKPAYKEKGSTAIAGSINLDGLLTISLNRVGKHSTVGQIQDLISKAQQTKPRSQRIADKASGLLTFVAVGVAILTLIIWFVILGKPFVFAITLAITVLVIACPHALGLAIPTVTTISTSLAVKNGVFIKDLGKLEVIKKADYIIFDKTGTLTKGEFGVTDIIAAENHSEQELLKIAASLGALSSHVLDKAIIAAAEARNINPEKGVSHFTTIGGRGISGEIQGLKYFMGNKAYLEESGIPIGGLTEVYGRLSEAGKTVIFVAAEKEPLGIVGMADTVKEGSSEAIKTLHNLGLKVAMLTGDNKAVAQSVAQKLGVDTYFAGILPEDKYKYVKELQGKGHTVLMVGDGINDAPALTQSDAGIAIGAGTDVAVSAGDAVLTQSNPLDAVKLIRLARGVYRKMSENLIWALGYNIIAIPAAAGVFASFGFFLRPEIGALIMSLSTVIVVVNALALKRIKLG